MHPGGIFQRRERADQIVVRVEFEFADGFDLQRGIPLYHGTQVLA